jgi:hypothetical protein
MLERPREVLRESDKGCFLDVERLAVISYVDFDKAVFLKLAATW